MLAFLRDYLLDPAVPRAFVIVAALLAYDRGRSSAARKRREAYAALRRAERTARRPNRPEAGQ